MDNLTIEQLRATINSVDADLVRLFNQRFQLVSEIGRIKKEEGLPVNDPTREAEIMEVLKPQEQYVGLVDTFWPMIFKFSKELEK